MARISRPPVWIIAHRGASADAPESTAAAIRRAVAIGVDMIELDVQLTRDGRLVIIHDDRLERTTTGRGRVSGRSYRELARLDAGSWFSPRFRGERILLMSQALEVMSRRCRANLELKRTPQPARLIRQFVRGVRRLKATSRVLASSFDLSLLRWLRRAAPEIASAALCARQPQPALRQAIALGCVAFHPRAHLVTPSLVEQAHAAGLRVHVWTVDELPEARRLRRCGVDGLFTNRPASFRNFAR